MQRREELRLGFAAVVRQPQQVGVGRLAQAAARPEPGHPRRLGGERSRATARRRSSSRTPRSRRRPRCPARSRARWSSSSRRSPAPSAEALRLARPPAARSSASDLPELVARGAERGERGRPARGVQHRCSRHRPSPAGLLLRRLGHRVVALPALELELDRLDRDGGGAGVELRAAPGTRRPSTRNSLYDSTF